MARSLEAVLVHARKQRVQSPQAGIARKPVALECGAQSIGGHGRRHERSGAEADVACALLRSGDCVGAVLRNERGESLH